MQRRIQRVHFVGIGGIGMCGIAELLHNQGYRVSGSDLREGPTVQRLRDLGIPVSVGHDGSHVHDADVVVYSSAVRHANPELVEAERRKVPVIPRAEMLAEVMRLKDGIAVAGSHGKTTTTSLIAHVLGAAGLDPTAVIGGRVLGAGSDPTGARVGRGDVLVAEADESDGSFLRLTPVIAVVTNIDAEHLDHYGTFPALQDAFISFCNRVPFWGASILCLDHPGVQAILPHMTRRTITYGFAPQADLVGTDATPDGEAFASASSMPAAGWAMSGFRCRAVTTRPTPWPPWPSPSSWTSPSPRPPRPWRSSAASNAASRPGAAPVACAWWMTTDTIPRRSAPPWPPRATWIRSAWWWSSSRTATRARAISSTSSPPASTTRTC